MKEIIYIIFEVVSNFYNVPISGIKSKDRHKELVKARHVSMYFIKYFIPEMTYEKIGKYYNGETHKLIGTYFNGKHFSKRHCSVLVSIEGIKTQIETVSKFRQEMNQVECIIFDRITELCDTDEVFMDNDFFEAEKTFKRPYSNVLPCTEQGLIKKQVYTL